MIQHLSSSHYIGYVFQGAFGFDSEHGFGSLPGLKHCSLEHHGCQLKKESPESALISKEECISIVKEKQKQPVYMGTESHKKDNKSSVCRFIHTVSWWLL